jgi:signal transduction histidine kinase
LANISHEIRTPLNAIVGFSRLIADVENVEDKMEFRRIIEENNERLLSLINELLDFSKIEANMVRFDLQPIGLNDLFKSVYNSFILRFSSEVQLINEALETEHYIYADKNRMIQVFSNLLDNALKHTKYGSVRLGYKLNGENVEIYVADTGVGILPERLDSIFNRFVKADENVQGTGLGLSICKMLIEKMGGQISVESVFGEGTTFKVTFPVFKKE